jgi:hypothetical protein
MAAKLPERLAADLARFEGADDPLRAAAPTNVPGATRSLAVGDAAEVWAPYLATATGFDHVDPGRSSSSMNRATSPRLPSSCGARRRSGVPSWPDRASSPTDGR